MAGDTDDGEVRITFRTSEQLRDEMDMIILQKKAAGDLPPDSSRSDVLRDLANDYVQGNANILTAAPITAD